MKEKNEKKSLKKPKYNLNHMPRVAIIVDQRFFLDDSGKYYTRANLRRELLDGYARYFEVSVFARVLKLKGEISGFGEPINNPSIKFVDLPHWELKNLLFVVPNVFLTLFNKLVGFDVVILRMMYISSILAFPICLIRKYPFIIQLVGDPEGISELKTKYGGGNFSETAAKVIRKIGMILLKKLQKRAAYCTAVSSQLTKKYFGNDISVADTRLEAIPSDIKKDKGDSENFMVLFVGRLVHMKNPNKLVEAISLLDARIKGLRVVFVGDGPLRSSLEQQVKSLNLTTMIRFEGFVSEPARLCQIYSAADVLVLPSSSGEGLPLVIIEAMAYGIPVIATNVGGIGEVVLHERTGYLLSKDDPTEIAYYLEMLAKNRSLCCQLGKLAKEIAQNYIVDAQVKKMRQIVDSILAEGGAKR